MLYSLVSFYRVPGVDHGGSYLYPSRSLVIVSWHDSSLTCLREADGFDGTLISMEYSTLNLNTTSHIYWTSLHANITPIARSPTKDPFFVSRILDRGAHRVIVPYIRSSRDTRDAVNAAKYQPIGHCSAISGLPHLQFRPLTSSIASPAINAATMVIPTIETLRAVKGAETIAAVPGVGFLLIRVNGIKAEMGIPGQYDALRVHHAYMRLLDAGGQHGM